MNALKSLGKLVWGSKDSPELFKLTSGVLYEVNPAAKVSRKCIFQDAELCIRRTDVQFQYQLVALRVFEEGEDELAASGDDADELDDECAFLIGVELKFMPTVVELAHGFKWVDVAAGDGAIEYEYIVEDATANKATRDAFAMAVARCAWERKARRSYTQAAEADVKAMLVQAEDDQLERMLNSVQINDDDIAAAVADLDTVDETPLPAPAAAPAAHKWVLPAEPKETPTGEVVVSILGEFYMFDAETTVFTQVAAEVALTVIKTDQYTYWLNVASDARSYVAQLIEPEMNAVFNHDHHSLIWNYFDENGKAYSFSVVSADDKHYEALHQGMTRAAYETLNREPWHKVNESTQDYLLDAGEEDNDMMDVPEDWHSDDDHLSEEDEAESEAESEGVKVKVESESEAAEGEAESESEAESDGEDEIDQIFRRAPVPSNVKTTLTAAAEAAADESSDEEEDESEEEESEGDEDDESDAGEGAGAGGQGAKNSMLAVGYKHDRSFVVRGSRIGVFRHGENDGIEFDTTISRIDDTHGTEFTPSSVMLHEQDSSMVLQNRDRPHELYRMDLEYGKVVEEWKVHEDIPTVSIAPNTKYSQMTGDKTLVGLSHNMLYRIDPRVGGDNMVVQNELQSYTTKSHFTAAATTESGAIAVGSGKGEIRLFDRLGVRAKTTLPALGEAILGIDVTSDGRYVVATCKTYLLLIDTKLPSDPAGKTGFQKSFLQAQKPAPRRLQLRPEHVVYMSAPISFTPAKFNQSPDGNHSEKTIVTSTGPFVITWNLRRALGTGRGDAYHIKQYADVVVADNFRFGQDRSIVVTLPNDVQCVKRSQLAKPTRESLMIRPPPRTSLLSGRDDVVNSPF
ncbi:Vacuolar import and degradation protein 27 [Coemansia spiralis]|uniref:Vacuolar import and degradation protein 27 n=1 Tax=Coemansia spiralis TaxID=417178 RepID=A0A9W8L5A3_9FUNG|nr:Vacuolar import and degradation protein 27 [Coemansia spiralis]